ncbi:MAG: ADP-L-glycero-D-manno-heptose 6-epimerase [Candidatus Cloacimonadota bacterium]|nr:ADP-L-glycero-D-manno-heptose 6-epimerase [Candidatus Cloacimonadota bacterium]
MKIIVTGGAGFIGSNLVYGLNKRGFDHITIVDNLSNAAKHLNLNRLKFLDYINKNDFLQQLEQFNDYDIIFHQGACSSTVEQDGKYMMDNNYTYSKKLLKFALNNKINFIYASSAATYGHGKNGFKEERASEYPLNIYGFSKFAFDNYVRRLTNNFSKKELSQVVGLRYFNVYGPQENHKGRMASVIYHFYHQAAKEGKISVFEGSDNYLRDFIWVEDAVDVNLFFLENLEKSGIFNCGSGEARSFQKLAELVQSQFPESSIAPIPFPQDLEDTYQTFTKADLNNLRNAGYKTEFTSLEKGVSQYLNLLQTENGFLPEL